MSGELQLDVDQAGELKAAFRRSGWTNAQIKALSEGDLLARVRDVILGIAEIKPIEHLIDFDVKPSIPNGWTILPAEDQIPSRARGKVKFDPTKVKLHLDRNQETGAIEGNNLRKKLENAPVYGAQLLDFYLANPHLIPEEWKGKYVFFWGTIYRDSDGSLYVRCLCWNGVRWHWDCDWLDSDFDDDDPAALSASIS